MATSKTSKTTTSSNDYGAGIANAGVIKNKRAAAKRENKRNPAVTIYLEEESHLELKIAAAQLGRPMADICREQVTKWLEAYKNGEIEE